jgi:predicted nucleotidyltransferase
MVSEETIRQAVDTLVREAHPVQVILFGSYGRGDATEDSDLDFLVVLPELQRPHEEMVRLRRAVGNLGTGVDILVVDAAEFAKWSEAPSTTLYWAKREGRALYDAA